MSLNLDLDIKNGFPIMESEPKTNNSKEWGSVNDFTNAIQPNSRWTQSRFIEAKFKHLRPCLSSLEARFSGQPRIAEIERQIWAVYRVYNLIPSIGCSHPYKYDASPPMSADQDRRSTQEDSWNPEGPFLEAVIPDDKASLVSRRCGEVEDGSRCEASEPNPVGRDELFEKLPLFRCKDTVG